MPHYLTDTIAAVSTAVGGGIGIVRLSGEKSLDIAKALFKPASKCAFKSHRIYYGEIIHKGEVIDEVMLSVMKSPKSYTKEDIVEINCHGGVKATELVLKAALDMGARLAQPGEFTKRAFLNGRIDLSKAHAVIDIINSKTELSHKQAISRLKGNLAADISRIRDEILNLIASIEVSIDYPEHDMEEENTLNILSSVDKIKIEIGRLINSADLGIIIREGVDTVILGKPNVGKSSLLNALLMEERAIVTDIPGTTRDVLKETINIKGIPINLIDTAGIRHSENIVEQFGIERSKKAAEDAALVLLVLDSSAELDKQDLEIIESVKDKKLIMILNKSDLEAKADYENADFPVIKISAKNNIGLENLYDEIYNMFFTGMVSVENSALISNVRDKLSLENALKSLDSAVAALNSGMTEDIVVIDLLEGYNYLGEILGETLDEDVIDRIFSQFCLGK